MTTTKKTKTTTPATTPAASPTPAATPPPTPPATPSMTGVANNSNNGTKVDLQAYYLALTAGLLAFFQPTDPFELPSGTFTRDALIASFQQFIGAAEATKSSNHAWRADVQTERAAAKAAAPLGQELKASLKAKYGKSNAQLLKFGISPEKTPVRTTTDKTTAVAKAKATRAARGTKGSVQKLEVVGNVTGVVITPVTAAPAGVTPAATGTAASGGGGVAAPAAPASPATGGTPTHS